MTDFEKFLQERELPPDIDFTDVDDMIEDNNITMPKADVENLISLVSKNVKDWNREHHYGDVEILNVIKSAINSGIINF